LQLALDELLKHLEFLSVLRRQRLAVLRVWRTRLNDLESVLGSGLAFLGSSDSINDLCGSFGL
jgi:hypothetical protein